MATLYRSIHYLLVDHPMISQYEWDPAATPAASRLFLSTTVAAYLSLTLLLHRFPILPTLPSATLRLAAAVHSLLLCLLSLIMAVACILSVLHQTPPENPSWFICFPTAAAANAAVQRGPTFFWAHVFYLSKILEFVDTLLILLSGSRSRRLSLLHVYHHAVVPVMCYTWLAAPVSMFPVGLVGNAAVHVLMYAYYAAAALGLRRPARWKRMVTECQIAQFLFGYSVSGLMLYFHIFGPGCTGVRAWGVNAVLTSVILALFIDFHVKNYVHKKKSVDLEVFNKDK